MRSPLKTVSKPWGKELWFAHNDKYVGKLIFINKGHRLSLAYHQRKHETLYVLKGQLALFINKKRRVIGSGRAFTITPRTIHRFAAPKGPVTLIEVSTPQVWDVVRLQDDYGRIERRK